MHARPILGSAVIFWLGLLPPSVRPAHESASSLTACACGEVFAFVADYVERNYAGFADKVTEAHRARYETLRSGLHVRARGTSAESECDALLREYVGFFRDPHLALSRHTTTTESSATDDGIRERFADWPVRQASEPAVREYVDNASHDLDPIEGVWEIVNADHRLAVIADESTSGRYHAITLRADSVWWVPGQIKATFERTGPGAYRTDFYTRDRSLREEVARLRQGLLVFSGASPWARIHPANTSGYDPARYRDSEMNSEFAVHRLDASTLLLRLPHFGPPVQQRIDSMIAANHDVLTRTPDLIIDVRGNAGGSVLSFRSVLPLIYTGPVVTPGLAHLATDDNIRIIQAFVETGGLSAELELEVQGLVARMREHRGAFTPTPDDTLRLDGVLPHPERVAVLADRGCASTCEAFVWIARQSDKVVVYGENTAGLLDYGDVLPVGTPCPAFRLHLPTARSNRVPQGVPLDNIGIEPDVRIPEDVLYRLDWVRDRLRAHDRRSPSRDVASNR